MEAASTAVEAVIETSRACAVAVVGSLVESVVGTVAVAVPEAVDIVEGIRTVESSTALVETRHAAVESVAVATGYVAKASAEADATIYVLLLFLSRGFRLCSRLLFGDRLVFGMYQSGYSQKDS